MPEPFAFYCLRCKLPQRASETTRDGDDLCCRRCGAIRDLVSTEDARVPLTRFDDDDVRAYCDAAAAGFECGECGERDSTDRSYRQYHEGQPVICPECGGHCMPIAA
jgi:Zn finger protein HypA/HybF involved in hydrogenase expression